MTISLGAWLASRPRLPVEQVETRAALQEANIADDPVSIVFRTASGVTLSAQSLRVEYDDPATEAESAAGSAGVRRLTIFGVYDHATLPDSDIKAGYRFNHQSKQYTVIDVIRKRGSVQARAEAI